MKPVFTIKSFPLAGAALHIAPAGHASLFQGEDVKAHLRRVPAGQLLGIFQISTSDDLHSEWEMHAAGDEILIMLTGELGVEFSDGSQRATSSLQARHGMVMPKGVWHRLVLREPGLLLALSPTQGTQLSHNPGGHS